MLPTDPRATVRSSTSTPQLPTRPATTAGPAGNYSNPDLDAALDSAAGEFDPAAQAALYQEACGIMNAELPWLPLWQSVRYHIVSDAMENVILIPAAGGGTLLRRRRDLGQELDPSHNPFRPQRAEPQGSALCHF